MVDGGFRHDRLALEHGERLGDREQADQGGDDRDAVIELEEAEGRARRGIDVVGADEAQHEPEEAGDQALQQVVGGDRGDQHEAEHHDDDHVDAAQIEADRGEIGQQRHGREAGDEPAHGRRDEAEDERLLPFALQRHRIAVERGRRGAAVAGHVDQDRRDAAAEMRGGVDRRHEGQRHVELHGQGERQQNDQRVRGAETRQGADDDAEQDRRDDDPEQFNGVAEQLEIERAVPAHGSGPAAASQSISASIGPVGSLVPRNLTKTR